MAELFDCPICLMLFEDPVTTACGHSYCMKCINTFWDKSDGRGGGYDCPQCRQTFNPRPDLRKNALLADLLEEHRKGSSRRAAAAAAAAAAFGAGGSGSASASVDQVPCDACTKRKSQACMFCLVCLACYCEDHLRPHFEVPPLKKHKLIQASARVKDSICRRHDKLLEIHCRTDQQYICLLCAMNEHRGHDTVSVAAEKCRMQKQLENSTQEIEDRLMNYLEKMTALRQAADCIKEAAWEACDDFERQCKEHALSYICYLETRCSEMREKVAKAEKDGLEWTSGNLAKLQHQVLELRRREETLEQLSLIEDPIQFLKDFQALHALPPSLDMLNTPCTPMEFATAQQEKLKDLCKKEKMQLSSIHEKNSVSNMPHLLEVYKQITREELLSRYKCTKMEVDPDTVAACLSLSRGNREISWSSEGPVYRDHADRFTYYHQALCKDGLTGCHYWEVEWDLGMVEVAVSYKEIQRMGLGNDCCFGHNDFSWKLRCCSSGCTFWHNNLQRGQIPPAHLRRVGVLLDFKAGILCFYSVSGRNLVLLHQVKTTFTKPLYPGFCVDLGSTLKICDI